MREFFWKWRKEFCFLGGFLKGVWGGERLYCFDGKINIEVIYRLRRRFAFFANFSCKKRWWTDKQTDA